MHDNDEINLLDYWKVLWRRKVMLVLLFLVSVLATMAISLQLPKYYKSETVLIASASDSGGLGAAFSSIPLAGALAGAVGIQTPADKLMVFLKSRTIAETVIRKFNLMKVFYQDDWDEAKKAWKDPANHPVMEQAVKHLTRDVANFQKSKEGAITIQIEWKDPKLAAEIANFYVYALNEFMSDKAVNTTVQIVDRAIPAEKKSRPKIALNMALAGIMSLFLGVFIAFFLEFLSKQKEASPRNNGAHGKIDSLTSMPVDRPSLSMVQNFQNQNRD